MLGSTVKLRNLHYLDAGVASSNDEDLPGEEDKDDDEDDEHNDDHDDDEDDDEVLPSGQLLLASSGPHPCSLCGHPVPGYLLVSRLHTH